MALFGSAGRRRLFLLLGVIRTETLSITSRVKLGERIRHLITSCVIACVRPQAHVRAVRNTISQRRLSMRDANRLAEDYIALWNETDQKRHLALLAEGGQPMPAMSIP